MNTKRINPIVGYVSFSEIEVVKEIIRNHTIGIRARKLGKDMRMKKLLNDLKNLKKEK